MVREKTIKDMCVYVDECGCCLTYLGNDWINEWMNQSICEWMIEWITVTHSISCFLMSIAAECDGPITFSQISKLLSKSTSLCSYFPYTNPHKKKRSKKYTNCVWKTNRQTKTWLINLFASSISGRLNWMLDWEGPFWRAELTEKERTYWREKKNQQSSNPFKILSIFFYTWFKPIRWVFRKDNEARDVKFQGNLSPGNRKTLEIYATLRPNNRWRQ
jgi:hypothetical protein